MRQRYGGAFGIHALLLFSFFRNILGSTTIGEIGVGLDVTGRYRYPPPAPDWLARHVEDVLDPHLPIIDPHHHLWVENESPYLLDEIAADLSDGHRIDATVFVQAHYGYDKDAPPHLSPVGETRKVAAIAQEAFKRGVPTAIAAGIVGFADLTIGEQLNETLDAHVAAGKGAFCGVRHSVSNDPAFPDGIVIRPAPPGLLADDRYRTGLSSLAARGLTYDAMLYQVQIPELTEMARALPDLAIVLDHAGCSLGIGPYEGREQDIFQAWRRDMAELAACPNVVVKIGGFGMIITGARWHERPEPPSSLDLASAWQPRVEACIDLFGANRCMFESNFPVDKAMYSYRTLWNAFKRLAAAASADEKAALFHETAARTYRMEIPIETSALAVAHG
jgi:L-fuconolactonase